MVLSVSSVKFWAYPIGIFILSVRQHIHEVDMFRHIQHVEWSHQFQTLMSWVSA